MLALAATLLLRQSLARTPSPPVAPALTAFPLELPGPWLGRDVPLDPAILDELRVTEHLSRVYQAQPAGGAPAAPPIWLYVGYYANQRAGATYHSPRNCLPGGGWHIREADLSALPVAGPGDASVNRVVVERGRERQLVLYWYQERGRVVASEYAAKAYLVWDAFARNRTDGAIVRVSTPLERDRAEALARALAFVRESWPFLLRHLPA